jgi:GTPase
LLLHVVDASSPHASSYVEHVQHVLKEIGAEGTKQILVLNKVDLIPDAMDRTAQARRIAQDANAKCITVSGLTGEGSEALLAEIDRALELDPVERIRVRIPAGEGASLHLVHERARVYSKEFIDDYCELEVDAPASVRRQLAQYELIS